VAAGGNLAPEIGRVASALVLPLGSAAVAAFVCVRLLDTALARCAAAPDGPVRRRAMHLAFFALAIALVFGVWYGHARDARFRGSGDVRHYRIQTENLLERGNLDLTDRMREKMDAEGVANRAHYIRRSHMHVNAAGRIHSGHSFGFPLLAAAFIKLFGASFGETLLKALIAAFALVGCRASCIAIGARRPTADLAALLLALSYIWVYDALGFLPEMLGFALCAGAVWGALAQTNPRLRLAATAVSAVSCAYLPYAHIRFAPMALALSGAFFIEALFVRDEPLARRKVPRLAAHAALCGTAWLLLMRFHNEFFGSEGAYNYGDIALGAPSAMWWTLFDRRGLAPAFPAIIPMFAATTVCLFRGGATSRRAFLAWGGALSVLLFCCCTFAAIIGTCLPGRYLFPVVPILLPFFTLALDRADRAGKLWMVFLAVMPVLYFVFLSHDIVGSQLLRVPAAMRSFALFQAVWEPWASHRGGTPAVHAAGAVFALSLVGISVLACFKTSRRRRAVAFPALFAVAFLGGAFVDGHDPSDRATAFEIVQANRKMHVWRIAGGHPTDVFTAFRETPDLVHESEKRPPLVMAASKPADGGNYRRCVNPEDLPPEPWGGDLKWVPVRKSPIAHAQGNAGGIAMRIVGKVVGGTARVAFVRGGVAANPGGAEIPEGDFDVVVFGSLGADSLWSNLYLALVGDEGAVYVEQFDFAPWPHGFSAAFPQMPGATAILDFTE
ncbi:MAG: hypothetical protein IJS46_02875, partial [Kiritimatiellae bacterium]|nr:hypothetical protein [Kiritimatiellia bacterium]